MKVYELLYLFNNHLKSAIIKYPKNAGYIISAYSNVSKKIAELYDKNKSLTNTDIQKLNITDHMKNKLQFLITKKIKPDEIRILKKNQLIDRLMDLSGIGKSKANSLIKSGLKSTTDLIKKKYKSQLNDATKLLMKYKPCRKIPYNEIKKMGKYLTNFPNSQIVGGFRREKPFSKDIDVMLVSDKKNILDDYLKYLGKKFNETHVYAKGNDKVSLILLVNSLKKKSTTKPTTKPTYYKIDIFRSPVINKYAMLLYSTGSKEFNIKMRSTASRLGYLLNQNGLYKKGSKTPVNIKSEKDFFNILNMEYVEPNKR